jgi:hypothetical protein
MGCKVRSWNGGARGSRHLGSGYTTRWYPLLRQLTMFCPTQPLDARNDPFGTTKPVGAILQGLSIKPLRHRTTLSLGRLRHATADIPLKQRFFHQYHYSHRLHLRDFWPLHLCYRVHEPRHLVLRRRSFPTVTLRSVKIPVPVRTRSLIAIGGIGTISQRWWYQMLIHFHATVLYTRRSGPGA